MSSPTLVDDTNPIVQYEAGWIWDQNVNEVDGTRHGAGIAGITASLSFAGEFGQFIFMKRTFIRGTSHVDIRHWRSSRGDSQILRSFRSADNVICHRWRDCWDIHCALHALWADPLQRYVFLQARPLFRRPRDSHHKCQWDEPERLLA